MASKAAFQGRVLQILERLNSADSDTSAIKPGGQASVTQVTYNNREAAAKLFDYYGNQDASKAIEDFEREWQSLQSLSHPSIVHFIDFVHEPAASSALLYMEWVSADVSGSTVNDLRDIIRLHDGHSTKQPRSCIPEAFIWYVLFHLGAALALCHHGVELRRELDVEHVATADVFHNLGIPYGHADRIKQLAVDNPTVSWQVESIRFSVRPSHKAIIHRDIKPENVLLKSPPQDNLDKAWRTPVTVDDDQMFCLYPTVLLGDFGLSVPLQVAKTVGIGSFRFTAPEVPIEPSRDEARGFRWTTKCDIFSVGATVWSLMSLRSPPSRLDTPYVFPEVLGYSTPLQSLVQKCVSISPSERPTALDILSTCIDRACWLESYVSPYGVLVSPDFHIKLCRSWQRCLHNLDAMASPIPVAPQLPSNLGNIGSMIDRVGSRASGHLAVFIAGAYHNRLRYEQLSHVRFVPLSSRIVQQYSQSSFDEPHRNFLPEGYLDELITPAVVLEELCLETSIEALTAQDSELVDFILQRARRVFAIAVMLELGSLHLVMTKFKEENFGDEYLPVQESGVNHLRCFEGPPWTRVKTWRFYETQWTFLAPVFSDSQFRLNLEPEHILPFTLANAEVKEGSFSRVFQVQIHPAHQKIQANKVAIKEMKEVLRGDEFTRAWDSESKALDKTRYLNHPNIVQHMASIQRGRYRYFLFQWADGGSLRDFWESTPRPHLEPNLIRDLVKQFRGLADGLSQLHAMPMRHGDLKPENIMRFTDSIPKDHSDVGILKIADIGLVTRHTLTTTMRRKTTSTRYATLRYEPPEATMGEPRSRLYDMWSMGCICLEMIVWLLYGYEDLMRFNREIQGPTQEPSPYFQIDHEHDRPVVRIHSRVSAWMDNIKDDPECRENTAISDLLHIVRTMLLVTLPQSRPPTIDLEEPGLVAERPQDSAPTRATAAEFREALDRMLARGNNSPTYWFTGANREDAKGPPNPPLTSSHLLTVPLNRPRVSAVPRKSASSNLLSPSQAITPPSDRPLGQGTTDQAKLQSNLQSN